MQTHSILWQILKKINSLNSHGSDNIVAKMFSKMTLYFQSNDLISRANASKQTSDVWKEKADKVKAKVENGKQKLSIFYVNALKPD